MTVAHRLPVPAPQQFHVQTALAFGAVQSFIDLGLSGWGIAKEGKLRAFVTEAGPQFGKCRKATSQWPGYNGLLRRLAFMDSAFFKGTMHQM